MAYLSFWLSARSRTPHGLFWPAAIFLFFLPFMAPLTAVAQVPESTDPQERPRIGLVLSGGGARGTAHVGVLKVIEEHRIRVDCISGTSMGSIVGGLYASGYAPEEIEALLNETDWDELFDDRPPRRRLPFRRKQDDLTYLAKVELGLRKDRFLAPSGYISGEKLSFLLGTLTMDVAGIRDFDDLPIPFRAVATDLELGEAVVLKSGSLPEAIRASMSVPGVFSPVQIDGRLLVDGGLVANLPVQVVKEMGADLVIAVDVGEPLATREDLRSLAQVTSQMLSMLTRKNVEESLPLADIVISPKLSEFGSAQFDRADEMVPLGEAAARKVEGSLAALSSDQEDYDAWIAAIRGAERTPIIVESVELAEGVPLDMEVLEKRIETAPGHPLDPETLQKDLHRIYQLGDFETVGFALLPGVEDFRLQLRAREKPWGPNYLRFGIGVASDLEGDSDVSIAASLTATRLNRFGAEWKTSLKLGENMRFFSEFYQPFSPRGTFFVAPYFDFEREMVNAYDEEVSYARYRTRTAMAGLDLGASLGRFGEVRVGIQRGTGRAEPQVGARDLPESRQQEAGLRFRYTIDQLDNPGFPREGFFAHGTLFHSRPNLGADLDYDRFEGGFLGAFSYKRSTLLATARVYSALGSELPAYRRFRLGGPFTLSGYGLGRVTGQYGGVGSLVYYYRLMRFPAGLGDGLYAGFSLEAGNLWEEIGHVSTGDLRQSASLFIGADTILGPAFFSYGMNRDGSRALYFYIGKTF